MKLLSDDQLERSAVVANCRMNRERELEGSNGGTPGGSASIPSVFLKERARLGSVACGWARSLLWDGHVRSSRRLVGLVHSRRARTTRLDRGLLTWSACFHQYPDPGLTLSAARWRRP